MLMTDLRDRLIEVLLWQELGGEKPPDLRQRVLARAVAGRWLRLLRPALLATAAAVVLGVLGWLVFKPSYPQPQASGQYEVSNGGLRRGVTLRTKAQPAHLELGGYCRVEVQPATVLRIEGDQYAEHIFLETGAVECSIAPRAGSFAVQTPIGTVSVVGTQFRVHLSEEKGEAEMNRRMVVKVLAGAVLVSGAWGLIQLHEGQQQAFGQEKKEGEGKKGVTVGLLVEKGKDAIFVRGDGEEKPRRFVPHWVGGAPAQGGGFDKHMLKIFHDLKVGSRIEVHWVFAERLRAVKVNVLKLGDGQAPPEHGGKKEGAQPKTGGDKRTGTTVGTLTGRENNKWLEIKGDGEEKARKYMVHAKLPAKLLQAAHQAPIGSRVSIEWVFTNHGPMVQRLEVVGKGSKE